MGNKFVKPLIKFVVFFAVLHLSMIIILTILTGNISYMNAFFIVSLNEIFPNINKGPVSFFVSILFSVVVYLFFYFRQKK